MKFIKRIINFIRQWLFGRLVKMRAKLRMGTLREAIQDADNIKATTDRKAIVIFNNHSGKFEAIEKQKLKRIAKNGRVKHQRAQTEGRKRLDKKTPGVITYDRVKQLEKKSAYVS